MTNNWEGCHPEKNNKQKNDEEERWKRYANIEIHTDDDRSLEGCLRQCFDGWREISEYFGLLIAARTLKKLPGSQEIDHHVV